MEINEEERLNNNSENLKCINCNINLEQYYSYCRICDKKFCLNCLIIHYHKYKGKMETENYELKDVKLDKNNSEIKIYNNNPELKIGRNYGIDLLRIYSMKML